MTTRASKERNRSELQVNRKESLGSLPVLLIERDSNSILSPQAMIKAAHQGLQDACANYRDAQARKASAHLSPKEPTLPGSAKDI